MLFPLENEDGETVYRLLSFDRDTIMVNKDGAMATGQYSYGRIYLWEALEVGGSTAEVPAAPEVTAENVETITTAEELWAISENLDGSYTLGADIDLSGRQWYPIGSEDDPFTGSFDGNGHKITGLTMTNTAEMDGVGLFGYTDSTASITDVTLENIQVTGRVYTGGLVGYNQGTISDCSVTGEITGGSEIGLLAGRNAGSVDQCAVAGKVTGTGNDSSGGLVGANSTGSISQSMANTTVSGTVNAGGLVGYNDRASITNCYATGTVTGDNYVGGLVGASGGSGYTMTCSITNSYADSQVTGNTVGTLVGFNDRHVTDCFGTGSASGGIAAGGLIGRNNQYGSVTNSYTDATVQGSAYTGSLFGKNSGDFETVGCGNGTNGIGNSPFSTVPANGLDFTAAESYAAGALNWNGDIWNVGNNALPTLKNVDVPVYEDTTEYTVTVETDGNGSATAAPDAATAGTEITLTATANGGYHFKEWRVVSGDVTIENDRFTMPAENVTVRAIFEADSTSGGGSSSTSSYTITVTQNEGGKITPSTTSVKKGSDKTFTITASEGYKISDVLVNGKSVGAVSFYTFENVTARHTITAKFEKVEEVTNVGGFTDVKSTDWFAEAVQYAVDEGLMNGTSETKFTPNGATTRGMIVTILYRQAGSPAVESDGATWWSDARVWAMENGVSDGTNMDKEITREQLATMLYRYAELTGEDVSKTTSLDSFQDGDKVSAYAVDALEWAAAEGIVTGKTGGLIDPQAGATRAETATMLMRYCERN